MFHLAAWFEAVTNVANTDIQPVVDQILTIQNSHFTFEQRTALYAARVGSASITFARLNSPQLRQIAPVYVRPLSVNLLPPTDDNVMMMFRNPYYLDPFEELALETTGTAACAENLYGLGWFGWRPLLNAPIGNVTPLRISSTTACVANVWTDLTITFADTIPNGRYAVVHSEHYSTNAIAHRWIFPNQVERPGFLSGASTGLRQPNPFYQSPLGVLGYFRSNNPPRLQVLNNSTDNSHTGFLWVIRVGDLAGFPQAG